MSHVIYAYGTLRPGKTEPVKVRGSMYDLGWFPGVRLGGPDLFLAERIEVGDIEAVDAYEGYDPAEPEMSLFLRRPYEDGFIYEINRDIRSEKLVVSGDWLRYKQQSEGRYGRRF